jgi:hypothetical protein
MGRQALAGGVLTIDHRSDVNIDYGDEREHLLESNL